MAEKSELLPEDPHSTPWERLLEAMFLSSFCSKKMPEDKLLKFRVQLLLREASFFPTLNKSCQAQDSKMIQRTEPSSGNPT